MTLIVRSITHSFLRLSLFFINKKHNPLALGAIVAKPPLFLLRKNKEASDGIPVIFARQFVL